MNVLPRLFSAARRTGTTRSVSFSLQSRFVHSTFSVAAEVGDDSNIVEASVAIEEEADEYKGQSIPIEIMMGQDDPKVLAKSEYPEWIADLATSGKSMAEIERKAKTEEASMDDLKRYHKLKQRKAIKNANKFGNVI